ncbi:polysaccharide deacetylase family protein [Actinomadura sp. 9N407]|uniref:polysaccharide deacetylase family protein n=1 Tax=Actinomadura sp. 9N407 TaxID=3375154 RepID=UPI0037ACF960
MALLAALPVASAGTGCSPREHREPPPVTDVTAIREVDPGGVPGLMPVTRSGGGDRHRLFASYPRISGAGALSGALARAQDEQVRRFTERTSRGPSVPELNIEWSLTAASGDVVGVRLVTSAFPGGTTRRTFWYDGAAGAVRSSADLVDGPGRLAALVRAKEPGAVPAKAGPEAFSSLAFNDQGDLVVEFSDDAVAAGTAGAAEPTGTPGRVAVALGHREYEPLLSAFGRRARDAALAPRPVLRLGPPESPTLAASRSPAPQADCRTAKCVALTFDDGPGPDTGRLLDALAERGARATFFVVGGNAAAQPELLRRQRAEGHEIGNHTHAHRDLSRLPALRISSDIQRTQEVIRSATGHGGMLLRPPYGAVNGTVTGVARSLGLVQIRWTADPERDGDGAAAIAGRAVALARAGGIIRMHDVRPASVDAVPEILDRLARDGYSFVTVSALRAGRRSGPG